MTAWPEPFVYEWKPVPEKAKLLPACTVDVYAPDGEHARLVGFVIAVLAIRRFV